MNGNDTVKLLRECDAGVEMGMASIDDVKDFAKSKVLKRLLTECKEEHETIEREVRSLLRQSGHEGKDPNPMVKGMSWIKTNAKLMADPSDKTVADLMTEGCDMGVRSLAKYLNEYKNASQEAKDIANRLITSEERLSEDIRGFL